VGTVASGPGLRRLGAWMGIAFVVLFVAGFLLFNTPNKGTDTAKWANWWNDSGHRTTAVIGAYLIVLGLIAFVWFAASLRERFQTGGGLLFTFASIFATVGLVSTLVRATIPCNKTFGGNNGTPVPHGADLARQLDGLGFGILFLAGGLALGVFIFLTSNLARRDGTLPGWLTMAGYVVAVLQLAAAFFFPFVLAVLWVLIAAILLVRHQVPAGGSS
jgi:hypothetical protein